MLYVDLNLKKKLNKTSIDTIYYPLPTELEEGVEITLFVQSSVRPAVRLTVTLGRFKITTLTSWWAQYGVLNHQPHDCLLNFLSRHRSKKIAKLRVTGLCAGNSPVTGEFPAQKASNAENVSIWWRHHVFLPFCCCLFMLPMDTGAAIRLPPMHAKQSLNNMEIVLHESMKLHHNQNKTKRIKICIHWGIYGVSNVTCEDGLYIETTLGMASVPGAPFANMASIQA